MQDANELVHCSYSLGQDIDRKGQPQTSVKVGSVVLTYDGIPTPEIIRWSLTPTILYNGVLVLCDADENPIDKVYFEDAACIAMEINYISEGSSSILTQIHLQPRKLILGNERLERRWLHAASAVKKKTASPTTYLKLAQPIGKITLDLDIDNESYEIERFCINFNQSVDYKGEPQEETRGGFMSFSIANMPDKLLTRWAVRDTESKNGVFVFKQGEQNSPLKIKFDEAYCVNMRNSTVYRGGVSTDYVISANEVDLAGKWLYENFNVK